MLVTPIHFGAGERAGLTNAVTAQRAGLLALISFLMRALQHSGACQYPRKHFLGALPTGHGAPQCLLRNVSEVELKGRTLGSRKEEPRYEGTMKSPPKPSRVPLACRRHQPYLSLNPGALTILWR